MTATRFRRPHLTQRQEEYLYCFGQGFSVKEAAIVLGVTPRTARAFSDRLRDAFGVRNKRELVVCAQKYFRASGPMDRDRTAKP